MHPSELPKFDSIPVFDSASARRHHSSIVAAAAVLVIALGSITLIMNGSTPAQTTPLPQHIAKSAAELPAYAREAANTSIELLISSEGHFESTAALVIAPGDLAVTTSQIPDQASITGSSQEQHRFTASLVSFDHALGFSVVQLGTSLPVTPLGVLPASATVLAIAPYFKASSRAPEFAWATTTLGDPVTEQSDGIVSYLSTASAPNLHGFPDTLAIDNSGRIVAVLSSKGRWFSAQYITKVAQVVTANGGCHVRLGIAGDSDQSGFVRVTHIDHGHSAGPLRTNDLIESINGVPMDSFDTLLAYLYASRAKQHAIVHLVRRGHARDIDVILNCQP